MPPEASPCGTALHRAALLLLDRAERAFPALRGADPPMYEHLLVPLHAEGRPIGTVWVITHTPERKFDAEDARLLTSLSRFASAAHQMTTALRAATAAR